VFVTRIVAEFVHLIGDEPKGLAIDGEVDCFVDLGQLMEKIPFAAESIGDAFVEQMLNYGNTSVVVRHGYRTSSAHCTLMVFGISPGVVAVP